jgi:short-subunit dehydrogenase
VGLKAPRKLSTVELSRRVMIVTGASSGIGAATARLAHAQGAHVVLAARRAERLASLADELPGSLAVPTDVTQLAEVAALCARALQAFGSIDVLVNNAGQGLHVPLTEVEAGDFLAVWELNVLAPLTLMQAVLPTMTRQGSGAIVNVSSMTSLMAISGLGASAATKSALNMLSNVARAEFAAAGVVVSLVLPGVVQSEFHSSLRAGRISEWAGSRAALPAEAVAEAILEAVRTGEAEARVTPPR